MKTETALAALLTVVGGGACLPLEALGQTVEWGQVPSCADISGQHLNASGFAFQCGSTGGGGAISVTITGEVSGTGSGTSAITIPANLGLIVGGVMYPLGDAGLAINPGLYTPVGGFPWSSGNITSLYAGVGGSAGSMTLDIYSATSQGATLSAVAGCGGIVVSSGGSAAPTSCTSTPISRGGQIFCSVTSVANTAVQGFCEPVFNHTKS